MGLLSCPKLRISVTPSRLYTSKERGWNDRRYQHRNHPVCSISTYHDACTSLTCVERGGFLDDADRDTISEEREGGDKARWAATNLNTDGICY